MNEELRFEEMNTEETEGTVNETQEATGTSGKGGGLVGLAVGIGLTALAGGVGYMLKNKDSIKAKNNEKKLKKQEKKAAKLGYKLVPVTCEEVFEEEFEAEEMTDEE